MADQIKASIQKLTNPDALRRRYGNRVGNEILFVLPVVQGSEKAIKRLLSTIDFLRDDEQRVEFIRVIWMQYYKNCANQILEGDN